MIEQIIEIVFAEKKMVNVFVTYITHVYNIIEYFEYKSFFEVNHCKNENIEVHYG